MELRFNNIKIAKLYINSSRHWQLMRSSPALHMQGTNETKPPIAFEVYDFIASMPTKTCAILFIFMTVTQNKDLILM